MNEIKFRKYTVIIPPDSLLSNVGSYSISSRKTHFGIKGNEYRILTCNILFFIGYVISVT
jgi:hypothetical protein